MFDGAASTVLCPLGFFFFFDTALDEQYGQKIQPGWSAREHFGHL